jgi:16S rRNA (guanine1207-N2)-methyltransferase
MQASTGAKFALMSHAIRPHEQLLIDLAPELDAARALCNTAGRGQFAAAYAAANSQSAVACWLLDLYQHQRARLAIQPSPPNLQLVCQPAPPAAEVDLVVWLFHHQDEAELTREMLQLGHQRLAIGGRMVAAIDRPDDQWLHEVLKDTFAKVTRRTSPAGVVYLATKTQPLRKVKDYVCNLAFRDGERLIQLRTRPGVFSHRQVDGGARALLKVETDPALNILDIGCGSGAVGIAAALRNPNAKVLAIDSNPRAIEATEWGCQSNGVVNLTAALDCDGASVPTGQFDLVLTNPPYFSNYRIADLFLTIARRALAPGGRLLLVTKTPRWFLDHLGDGWREVATGQVGQYVVLSAIKDKDVA